MSSLRQKNPFSYKVTLTFRLEQRGQQHGHSVFLPLSTTETTINRHLKEKPGMFIDVFHIFYECGLFYYDNKLFDNKLECFTVPQDVSTDESWSHFTPDTKRKLEESIESYLKEEHVYGAMIAEDEIICISLLKQFSDKGPLYLSQKVTAWHQKIKKAIEEPMHYGKEELNRLCTVQYCLSKLGEENIRRNFHQEILRKSIRQNRVNLVYLITKNSPETQLNYVPPAFESTIFHWVAAYGKTQMLDCIMEILKKQKPDDADEIFCLLSQKDKNDMTPLHKAVEANNLELVKWFVEEGPDDLINQQTTHGFTASHIAAYKRHSKIALYLIEKGANVHLQTQKGDCVLKAFLKNCPKKEIHLSADLFLMERLVDKIPMGQEVSLLIKIATKKKLPLKRLQEKEKKNQQRKSLLKASSNRTLPLLLCFLGDTGVGKTELKRNIFSQISMKQSDCHMKEGTKLKTKLLGGRRFLKCDLQGDCAYPIMNQLILERQTAIFVIVCKLDGSLRRQCERWLRFLWAANQSKSKRTQHVLLVGSFADKMQGATTENIRNAWEKIKRKFDEYFILDHHQYTCNCTNDDVTELRRTIILLHDKITKERMNYPLPFPCAEIIALKSKWPKCMKWKDYYMEVRALFNMSEEDLYLKTENFLKEALEIVCVHLPGRGRTQNYMNIVIITDPNWLFQNVQSGFLNTPGMFPGYLSTSDLKQICAYTGSEEEYFKSKRREEHNVFMSVLATLDICHFDDKNLLCEDRDYPTRCSNYSNASSLRNTKNFFCPSKFKTFQGWKGASLVVGRGFKCSDPADIFSPSFFSHFLKYVSGEDHGVGIKKNPFKNLAILYTDKAEVLVKIEEDYTCIFWMVLSEKNNPGKNCSDLLRKVEELVKDTINHTSQDVAYEWVILSTNSIRDFLEDSRKVIKIYNVQRLAKKIKPAIDQGVIDESGWRDDIKDLFVAGFEEDQVCQEIINGENVDFKSMSVRWIPPRVKDIICKALRCNFEGKAGSVRIRDKMKEKGIYVEDTPYQFDSAARKLLVDMSEKSSCNIGSLMAACKEKYGKTNFKMIAWILEHIRDPNVQNMLKHISDELPDGESGLSNDE